MNKVAIKRGQVWKRKSDGIEVLVYTKSAGEDRWQVFRTNNRMISHRMTAWEFWKYWTLV